MLNLCNDEYVNVCINYVNLSMNMLIYSMSCTHYLYYIPYHQSLFCINDVCCAINAAIIWGFFLLGVPWSAVRPHGAGSGAGLHARQEDPGEILGRAVSQVRGKQ
jgi:hypothetical protein